MTSVPVPCRGLRLQLRRRSACARGPASPRWAHAHAVQSRSAGSLALGRWRVPRWSVAGPPATTPQPGWNSHPMCGSRIDMCVRARAYLCSLLLNRGHSCSDEAAEMVHWCCESLNKSGPPNSACVRVCDVGASLSLSLSLSLSTCVCVCESARDIDDKKPMLVCARVRL